ncbi:MAG: hypothetical protein R3D71_07930 [Rickettsiales bacterium]
MSLQKSLDETMDGVSIGFSVSDKVHTIPVRELGQRKIILENLLNWRNARTVEPLKHKDKKYAHVGFAGLFNLQAAVAGRHDIIVLVDCNKKQIDFWKDAIKLFKDNDNEKKFLEEIDSKISPFSDNNYTSGLGKIELRHQHVDENGVLIRDSMKNSLINWLKNSELLERDNYKYLHKLAKDGNIVTAELDIHNEDRIKALRSWLDKQNVEVRSVYASNILDLEKDNPPKYYLPDVKIKYGDDSSRISIYYTDKSGNKLGGSHPFRNGIKALRENGMSKYRGGFYKEGDGTSNIDLLCNSEESEIFRCSTDDLMPLITIKGKYTASLADNKSNNRGLRV